MFHESFVPSFVTISADNYIEIMQSSSKANYLGYDQFLFNSSLRELFPLSRVRSYNRKLTFLLQISLS